MFTGKRHPLFTQQTSTVPIITAERYEKWYELYIVMPDSTIKTLQFHELSEVAKPGESAFCDHAPNPFCILRYAEKHNMQFDMEMLGMATYTWFIEYVDY